MGFNLRPEARKRGADLSCHLPEHSQGSLLKASSTPWHLTFLRRQEKWKRSRCSNSLVCLLLVCPPMRRKKCVFFGECPKTWFVYVQVKLLLRRQIQLVVWGIDGLTKLQTVPRETAVCFSFKIAGQCCLFRAMTTIVAQH